MFKVSQLPRSDTKLIGTGSRTSVTEDSALHSEWSLRAGLQASMLLFNRNSRWVYDVSESDKKHVGMVRAVATATTMKLYPSEPNPKAHLGVDMLQQQISRAMPVQNQSAEAVFGHLLQLSAMSEEKVEQSLRDWSDMLAEDRQDSKRRNQEYVCDVMRRY